MKRMLLLLALLAALPLVIAALRHGTPPRAGAPHFALAAAPSSPSGAGDPVEALSGGAVEPPDLVLRPGDHAPDFEYLTEDGQAVHLHDVLAHGHVLLVFEPSSPQLGQLERERAALAQRGILVVAVLDRGERAAWALAQRLGVHFTVAPDPRAVIGSQFNVLGANTRRPEPAWFAIDRDGRIRALERWRVPDSDFTSLAAGALHLPAPDAIAPGSHVERTAHRPPR